MTSNSNSPSLDTLVSLAKRRGLVWPASEIYGGISGFYNYGPYGVQMARNIKDAWWDAFVRSVPNIHGLDSSIIQNPKLWQASGHVAGFTDPMVEDLKTKKRYRADHIAGIDSNNLEELKKALSGKKSPDGNELSEPRVFNMMFKTHVGAVEDEASTVYLRPETAGGIYTDFDNVREGMRAKIPFGVAQIGKVFRNEISPRDFLFRQREFEQMELQYFVNPKNADEEFTNLRQITWDFFVDALALEETRMKWHEHDDNERAHYATAAFDIQFDFPIGFKELAGVHNRTDFDLSAHSKLSGKDLSYFDPATEERYTPYVMEMSIGLDRLFLALLTQAYTEEEVKGEKRVVLKLEPGIAPVDIAVLPLSNKSELAAKAKEVYKLITGKTDYTVEYDETQSIGKRYRRQDEIGTPKCVTIDFATLDDKRVTIRDRDSMKQSRVPLAKLLDELG